MNQSFLFFELIGVFIVHLLILEPETYVVVEQFGAENIPLLSGRLVSFFVRPQTSPCIYHFLVETLSLRGTQRSRVGVPALARNFFELLRKQAPFIF